MLTRLKVTGFKNLVDVDIRLGPFTCIAGPNAVGKSNLFDAITFLSYLTNNTLLDAALKVRDESGKRTDVRSLLHRIGEGHDEKMSFEAEMILPKEGVDDLGQTAKASTTFVRYRIDIGYRSAGHIPSDGSLEILHEELDRIKLKEASKRLKFPHNATKWRRSVITGMRTSPFISTNPDEGGNTILLHQEGVKPGFWVSRSI